MQGWERPSLRYKRIVYKYCLACHGFIQALQLMSVLWKKIEFYKGKDDCETIVIAAWDLGQGPGGLLGSKVPFLAF